MAAGLVLQQGRDVVLHARNDNRANEVRSKLPGAGAVAIGDLSSITQTKSLAEQVILGSFDAIIHNAAVGYREPERLETENGLSHAFGLNTLAPYIVMALILKPKRLIYLSSGRHPRLPRRPSHSWLEEVAR